MVWSESIELRYEKMEFRLFTLLISFPSLELILTLPHGTCWEMGVGRTEKKNSLVLYGWSGFDILFNLLTAVDSFSLWYPSGVSCAGKRSKLPSRVWNTVLCMCDNALGLLSHCICFWPHSTNSITQDSISPISSVVTLVVVSDRSMNMKYCPIQNAFSFCFTFAIFTIWMTAIAGYWPGNYREKVGGISITGMSSHLFIIIQIRSPLGNKETFLLRA